MAAKAATHGKWRDNAMFTARLELCIPKPMTETIRVRTPVVGGRLRGHDEHVDTGNDAHFCAPTNFRLTKLAIKNPVK
jgi:hypothetical protein